MGLDGVELVIEVEEAFGIKISDEEAPGVLTVGDLYELVQRKTGRTPPVGAPCLSASTFRFVRSATLSLVGVGPSRIRPRDRLDSLLPKNLSRNLWSQFQERLSLQLPDLVRPVWVAVAIVAAAVVAGMLIAGSVVGSFAPWAAFPAGVIGGFAVYFAGYSLTTSFATRLPRKCVTFRDLTNALLICNAEVLSARFQRSGSPGDWNESLWLEVASIVVRQLGISPEQVTPNALFVNDLGMD